MLDLGTLAYALEYNPGSGRNADDIDLILATFEGENEEHDWVWIVEFNDGVRGVYIGGCDYTGWDCQSSLTLFEFHNYDQWEDIVRANWSAGWSKQHTIDEVIEELKRQFN